MGEESECGLVGGWMGGKNRSPGAACCLATGRADAYRAADKAASRSCSWDALATTLPLIICEDRPLISRPDVMLLPRPIPVLERP